MSSRRRGDAAEREQVMLLHLTVNGEAVTVRDVDPDERLLAVLRERLGRVEVKDGCSPQGQCGCCTVWLDGQPRAACVVRAEQADGRSVTTSVGLPHAIGSALAAAFDPRGACGATQCGF
ncbi:MAG: (2Fe-2S)-binding protein, partial [Actinomycetes bacterium]